MDFILGKKNIHTELHNMTRSTNRALAELMKLRHISKPEKRDSSNKDGSNQTSTLFQKGKTMQEKRKREGTTPPETPRQKKPKVAETRNEVPSDRTPIGSQAKDPDWTTVVKRGIRKKAERPNADGTEKSAVAYHNRAETCST